MGKNIILITLLFFTEMIAKAQYQGWQPSNVYAIDKAVINQIKSQNGGGQNKISEKEFTELQSKIQRSISDNKPAYSKLDTILSLAGIDFTGVSSPEFNSVAESIMAPLQSYAYRQYIQKEYADQDVLISKFKTKLINYVSSSPVVASVKEEINSRVKALRNDLVFGLYNAKLDPIENLSPLLDQYLNKSLGPESWSSLKNKLSTEAEKIIDISRKLNEGLSEYLQPRIQVLKDIEYFTDQIKKTEALIKNGKPEDVIRLVQTNDYYQKIIESANLKGINDFALKLVGIGDDINKVDRLLKSNDNPLKKALGTFEVLEKNLKTFFPEASAELNRSLASIENAKQLTKANFYASLTSQLVNSDILGLSPEDKKNANVLINAGMAYVNFSSGNILGGITCTIGALDGLGLFGGNKNNDGLAKMQMELQKTMMEGFSTVLKGIDNINKNIGIVSEQITEAYNNLSKQILDGRKEAAEYYKNLSQQMQQGFTALHEDMLTISKQVGNLHEDMIRMHDENSLKLNMIDRKLKILTSLTECTWKTVLAGANQDLNSCNGCIANVLKGNPKTQQEYKELFDIETQTCYKAIIRFINSMKPDNNLIDYVGCNPDVDAGLLGGYDPQNVYGKLRSIWNTPRFNNQANYLSLINPSVSVGDEIKIYDTIMKKSSFLFTSGNSGMNKDLSLNPDDQLNDAGFVLDIAGWYLQMLPFKSVRDKFTGGVKSNSDLVKPLDEKDADIILNELHFLRTVIQNTVVQQSLMSGTRLLNSFYSTLQRGGYEEKKDVFEILKKNFLLQINIAKFICSAYDNAANRSIIIPTKDFVIMKLNSAEGGNFYMFFAKEISQNLLTTYENEKENTGKLISSLVNESDYIIINDKITVANLTRPERVLPPAFHQLLKLHKTYTDMITEIGVLKTLTTEELTKLKSVYLN